MHITFDQAVKALKEGNVIAIPTDTVYGVAADLHQEQAVRKIFGVKKRPITTPLIVLVSDTQQVMEFVDELPKGFLELSKQFWPGALTLVVPIKTEKILPVIRANLATAGFRVPKHPLTLKLIREVGPIVATSANISGKPSPIDAKGVEEGLGRDFPVLDGGLCERGVESTILEFRNGQWQMNRQGAISAPFFIDP